jgi:hypothetical protein
MLTQKTLRLYQRTEVNQTGLTPAPAAILAALAAILASNEQMTYLVL